MDIFIPFGTVFLSRKAYISRNVRVRGNTNGFFSAAKLFAESIVQISDRIFPPHSFPPSLLLPFPREGILGIRLISRDEEF